MLLRNHLVDFVEICNVCARKVIIEAAKRIINSDKVCRSYSDFNFGVTFLEHSVYTTKIHFNVKQQQKAVIRAFPRSFALNRSVTEINS